MSPEALSTDFDPPQLQMHEARRMVGYDRGQVVASARLTEDEGNRIIDLSAFDLHEDDY
jgi:hypothetical protein